MGNIPLPPLKRGKYFIITFGCAMNFSDSERIAAILESQGYAKAPSKYEADLVIMVACAVRQHAMDRIYGNTGEIRKRNPESRIIITGCILEQDVKKIRNQKSEIRKLTDFIEPDNNCALGDFFKVTPKYQFRDTANVPIMTGCNNFCSYCAVPYTRGREYSRPADEIICEISRLIENGCKEITLLGQNVNSYKSETRNQKPEVFDNTFGIRDSGFGILKKEINFTDLLRLINKISGEFSIKFLTSHPKNMSDELIEAIADCEKVDKERLHLPIQSGDDTILEKMNRKYTVEHYKNLIKKIKAKLPDIKISTDIIVGFPGETEEQFENTINLFREIEFCAAYVSCYSPRSGTVAAGMTDDVELCEKRRRKVLLERLITN